MRFNEKSFYLTSTIWIVVFTIGCTSNSTTRLCDTFQSYLSVADVSAKINQANPAGEWKKESKKTEPSGSRPAYEFITMSGPFKISGIDGHLKLTFYNDRLMSADFSTLKGHEYIASLRLRQEKVPENAGEEITTDRRTGFRYYLDPDSAFRFTWYDKKLEAEWADWLRKYS